jgi:hypothetical protein
VLDISERPMCGCQPCWTSRRRLLLRPAVLLAFSHGLWANLFGGSAVIVSEFTAITPLMTVSIVLDSAQGVLSGERAQSSTYRHAQVTG